MLIFGKILQVLLGLFQAYFLANYFPSDSISALIINLPIFLLCFSTELHYPFYRSKCEGNIISVRNYYSEYIYAIVRDALLSLLISLCVSSFVYRYTFQDSLMILVVILADKIADELQRYWLVVKKQFQFQVLLLLSRRLFLLVSVIIAYSLFGMSDLDLTYVLIFYSLFSVSTIFLPFICFHGSSLKNLLLIKSSFLSFVSGVDFKPLLTSKLKALILVFSASQILILARTTPLVIANINSVRLLVLLQVSTAIFLIPSVLFTQQLRHFFVIPKSRLFYAKLIAGSVVLTLILNSCLFMAAFVYSSSLFESNIPGINSLFYHLGGYSLAFVLLYSISLVVVSVCSSCNEWLYDIKARLLYCVVSMLLSLIVFLCSWVLKDSNSGLAALLFLATFLVYPLAGLYMLFTSRRVLRA
jgi:hypothetical protein